jgi:hypothetical protein
MCEDYPGMKIDDETLIDYAVSCSSRGMALKAESILLHRKKKVNADECAREGLTHGKADTTPSQLGQDFEC